MTRVINKNKAHYDVYIGRPSKWGNPFTHLPLLQIGRASGMTEVATREEAVRRYEEWIKTKPELMADAKKELRGKTLGCFCKPLACHGDVLAKIADEL